MERVHLDKDIEAGAMEEETTDIQDQFYFENVLVIPTRERNAQNDQADQNIVIDSTVR